MINNLKFRSFVLAVIVIFTTVAFAGNSVEGLEIGELIPAFNANDQNGELWKSGDHIGKEYVVVYFYPAALTGGCTMQACSYRDSQSQLNDIDATVIGVSGDPVKNLKIFEQTNNLNFTLLSDVNGHIAGLFGVPQRAGGSISREVDGKDISLNRSTTASRWTFIVDKSGKIIYKNTEVDVNNDSGEVIEFLKQLNK